MYVAERGAEELALLQGVQELTRLAGMFTRDVTRLAMLSEIGKRSQPVIGDVPAATTQEPISGIYGLC